MKQIKFADFVSDYREFQEQYEAAIRAVLESGWHILGKEVKSFEESLAKYLGAKHCIGVGNGLEALQISLMSLGIKKGDEVITSPLSAVATTLAILAVHAKPVFVDTDEWGLMDPALIKTAITKKTKAILPVHLYGLPCDLDGLKKICRQHGLFLIEDACQAHGTTYKKRKVGTDGILNCFSFYPTKNLGAFGDGGAIVTNDFTLANVCREIRDYGQQQKYIHIRYGLNSRLDELQAGLLKVKLKHLDEINRRREELARTYLLGLKDLKNKVQIPKLNYLCRSNYHLFVIRAKQRDELMK